MSTHSFVTSASQTLLVPLPGTAVVIQVARPVLGIASAAAAAVFLASGGAAVTAAADMQALLALGMSNCAPSVLKKSSDVSLFLLSPFYALGLEAMAFGNIGLFVVLWLLQFCTVLMMERPQQSVPVARRVTNAPSPADDVRPRLKYPNLSYAAGLLLVQGSLSGASSMSTVVLALSFVLSVTSCLKAIHVLFVSWWLQRLKQTATIAKSAPMAESTSMASASVS